MEKAVWHLNLKPDLILVDGNHPLNQPFLQKCLIQGDRLSHSIGAASIMAKVVRDKLMESWHHRFPVYNFRRIRDMGPGNIWPL